ncbi:carbohydrate-binding domain-containing protein [Formosa sp. S-31]|uniref:carbohydrate-binding domain-containing protein n=1 Tax=Formosa sp. S-31 TaxID=2790949 RepID=UPI003EBD264F
MKTLKKIKGLILVASLICLSGCSSDDDVNSEDSTDQTEALEVTITETNASGTPEGDVSSIGADEDDLVENASFEYTVKIDFSENAATISNPVSGNGVEVTQEEGKVTVVSAVSGVAYEISGSTNDGALKIYSDKKFKLSLKDASITNNEGPAINVQSSKTVFVILEGENAVSDAASYSNIPEDEDAKAAFFSEGQLVFSGTGSLNVAGKYKHGIVSDDYIRVRSGEINITEAVKDGIHTNDYLIVDGGTLNIVASSDGIDCEEGYIIVNDGTFNLDVADDGIVASYDITDESEPDTSITPNVTINGGTFNINTFEGEGIESKGILTINDGTFEINAEDDGLNAIGNLYINGGKIYVYSNSNDAIDTNADITITGGTIIAIGSNSPEGGVDADNNTFKITGGTLLGLGGTTTKPTASVSTQNALIFDGINANTLLHIQSEDGLEALTYQIPKSVNTILYSSAKLESDVTYNIYSGGSVSNGTEFQGLYISGSYSGGTSFSKFTVNATVTQIGGAVGPGGR